MRNYISRIALNMIVIIATHVVSDKQPFADAKPASPPLEDYYLYVFGERL